jgi:MerC mercury resistance protein
MMWDRLGMVLSGLCVVHCLAMPFALAWLPLLGSVLPDDVHFHRWLAGASVAISGVSLLPGFLRHQRRLVALLAVAGLTCLLTAAIAQREACCHRCCYAEPTACAPESTWWLWCQSVLTPLGGVCLTVAHLNNRCHRPCCDS